MTRYPHCDSAKGGWCTAQGPTTSFNGKESVKRVSVLNIFQSNLGLVRSINFLPVQGYFGEYCPGLGGSLNFPPVQGNIFQSNPGLVVSLYF